MAPLIRLVLAAGPLLLTSLTAQAVSLYRITDLGDLPGGDDFSVASGINETGVVVGTSSAATGSRAFLWTRSGGMQNLGDLPGGSDSSGASGINNAGQVVGSSDAASGGRAFRWTPGGGMQNLGVLPGSESSAAHGINNAGQVVGTSSRAGPLPQAFRWTAGGGMQGLQSGGGGGDEGRGVNDAGQVVGSSNSFGFQAVLWTASGDLQFLDNGTPGGAAAHSSAANGINNAGQVVGGVSFSTSSGPTFAALWTAGELQDLLGGFDTFANDINEAGQVVGVTFGENVPFLWTAAGGMQDLNALIDPLDPLKAVTTLSQASGINNAGQIVGSGFINGKEHAYLLTLVPEPETWALLLVGLGLIRLFVRRRASLVA